VQVRHHVKLLLLLFASNGGGRRLIPQNDHTVVFLILSLRVQMRFPQEVRRVQRVEEMRLVICKSRVFDLLPQHIDVLVEVEVVLEFLEVGQRCDVV
jgi:hypothetical protein